MQTYRLIERVVRDMFQASVLQLPVLPRNCRGTPLVNLHIWLGQALHEVW